MIVSLFIKVSKYRLLTISNFSDKPTDFLRNVGLTTEIIEIPFKTTDILNSFYVLGFKKKVTQLSVIKSVILYCLLQLGYSIDYQ